MEFEAPEAPDSAEKYMPSETETFTEGLLYIIKNAIGNIQPNIIQAAQICLKLIAISIMVSLINSFGGISGYAIKIASIVAVSVILFQPSDAFLDLGIATVNELSEYAKLFFPVMATGLAAQGGISTSTTLYAGTTFFNSIITSVIANIIVPLLYFYLCFSVGNSAFDCDFLFRIKKFTKWSMTWLLKIVLQ